jgi:hypothetical protein
MPRVRRGFVAAIFVVSSLAAHEARAADPYAIVASAKGRVDVTHAGEARRATFGTPLERGDKVTVGAGGAATVYLSDGNVIELAERSAVTIGGRVTPAAKIGPGSDPSAGVYNQVSRFVTGGSRQNGLVAMSAMRGGAETALIVAPRQSDVLGDRPSFHWRAAEGATRYRVSVSGDAGATWTREVTTTQLDYPADAPALARDADYLWKVEAFGDKGPVREESSAFRVLSDGVVATVRADLTKIAESTGGPETPAAHYLAGSYLSGRGLYDDATSHFVRLGELSPESPAPHEALGNVYRAIGLTDLAAAEYQRALELTRSP